MKTNNFPRLFMIPLLLLLTATPAWAYIPFKAEYLVESRYKLAPSVTLEHEIRWRAGMYHVSMEAGNSLVSWKENSRFTLGDASLPVSKDFRSRTRVIQNRNDRKLSFDGRADGILDRQTLVFALPLIAHQRGVGASGMLESLNHRGREKNIEYFVHELLDFEGTRAAMIDVWFEGKPDELLGRVYFSLEVPGLILQAEAFDEDGRSLGTLKLTRWSPI